jgi:hypothetical protein
MTPYRGAPLTNEQAWAVYDALLADDRIVLQVDEPEGLEPYWRQYAMRPLASTKLWMDAYLAAFARAGGYRVVTADRGFQQFEGVDVVLIGEGVGS